MANPFGKDQKWFGSFRADDLTLTIAGKPGDGALVQSASFTMTRQINMLYEIGSTNIYYVGNRRNGTVQMSRVVGGSSNFKDMVMTYGDMCKPVDLSLETAGGCGGASGPGVKYNMKQATLTQLGMSVTAQEIVITENLGFIFADLDYM